MSSSGTHVPPSRFPKSGADTKLPGSAGCKGIKEQELQFGQPSDIGTAPTSRVYTRDYSKVGRAPGDKDLVTEALGNPLGL